MSGNVTVGTPSTGTVTVPSTTGNNQAYLAGALARLNGFATSGFVLGNGTTAPTVPGGTVGIGVMSVGGSVTIPTGYGVIALTGSGPTTLTGGDGGANGTQILSGLGGLTYTGAAGSIIAAGGNNVINATQTGTFPAQFIDVNGSSTVTGNNDLILTEGGAASINAGSGNFVVTSGQDTVNTGAGNNTVAAVATVGGLTNAGAGDLVFVTGGSTLGAQTIMGGLGNETVFAGPKSIDWIGSDPGGTLIFIGGPTASTVIGGGGQETLFAGTGGGLFQMGSANGDIFVGDTGNYTVSAGNGNPVLFGNAGSNIEFFGAASQTGNLIVLGTGSETVNAAASHGNVFITGPGDATITGSSAGGDAVQFFNQGTLSSAHTITITDFAAGVNPVFIGFGFNPSNVHDGATIAGPAQVVIGGSDHITLSDNTTIILQGFGSQVQFNNFNAIV